MTAKTQEAVRKYLSDNLHEALDIAKQLNAYDGSNEWSQAYDFDDLCEWAAMEGKDAVSNLVQAAVYGDVCRGMVRYNGYGNLISGEYNDLLQDANDYLSDIINDMDSYIANDGSIVSGVLSISQDLKEAIKDAVDDDDEDENDNEDDNYTKEEM